MYTNTQITAELNRTSLAPRSRGRSAFSLVEVTMAMGLVSFCLVAMLGMLPVGLRQERSASEQLAASQLFTVVENEFQKAPDENGNTPDYKIKTGVGSEDSFLVDDSGERTVIAANAAYKVWYRTAGTTSGDANARQLHVYITRAQAPQLAQQNVVAEGIVLN